MSNAKRLLIATAVFLGLAAGATAQITDLPAPVRHYYESCAKSAHKQRSTYYIAWVPGAAHTCNISRFPPAEARAFALKNCETSMVRLRKAFGVKDRCRIAVNRGKVVDSVYRRAWKLKPLPVRVVIFDAETGKKQVARGKFHYGVSRYRGLQTSQVKFKIIANGVDLCNGTYSGSVFSNRVKFRSRCFDEDFKGRSRITRATKINGIYEFLPEKVRVKSGRSWMELSF